MKKILGLDLGTTSIGWALVNEAENENEKSAILKLGVRVNPLTVDELQNFEKGKSITTNADRTLKRSMRRNLQRYKLRRENLIEVLKNNGFITDETILSENGNNTTFETYRIRAKCVSERITLEELARVLLMINKKRGYKSSRKAKSKEEGQLIDGMEIARQLYTENITPGHLVLNLLKEGKRYIPDFYRSDLQDELDKIWRYQQPYYPDILTSEFKTLITGKTKNSVASLFRESYGVFAAENNSPDKKIQPYKWRVDGLSKQLSINEVAFVIGDISGAIANSSGYLGAIGDRSKELYFTKQTVGQSLMAHLNTGPNYSLKNQVFYRQDYLDEFNAIWETQSRFHKVLTPELKREIRDIIIFYQRRLKSQKGLISFCELESRKVTVIHDDKEKTKTIGSKVCPRSSPLFQEFRTWQTLNNLEVKNRGNGEKRFLEQEEKDSLWNELQLKESLSKEAVLKILFQNPKEWELNFKKIEGDHTQATLYGVYQTIIKLTGHGEFDFSRMKAAEITEIVTGVFKGLGYKTDFLSFNSDHYIDNPDSQPLYRLWHLLYSFEGDNSITGKDKLVNKIASLCGFEKEYAVLLTNITFQQEYGSLSEKAIKKILPYMKSGHEYSEACSYAGYNHSKNSLTKEELDQKELKNKLEILQKNSLRNPVVEKILNQMINVVNAVIEKYGKPDEIRIELARELKKNAQEREGLTKAINQATSEHEQYRTILKKDFGLTYISRNDIIRYKLYRELETNGYHTLYSNTYISPLKLFSKEFDIEHIIPQSRLFDDSFSNKTIESRSINIEKGNETAYDYILAKQGEDGLKTYLHKTDELLKGGKISRAKYNKLRMQGKNIPDDFIARDLRDTQYIARKAKSILEEIVREVISTSGTVTDRLREDWQLIDVMQELNWDKYDKIPGQTEIIENREGQKLKRIKNWTKRNDHRHHAMDALTIAFTKRSFIQYLNNLNANSKKSGSIYGIEHKEIYKDDNNKPRFIPPIPLKEFRAEARKHLESTLVSIKAKNKVVTVNINKTKKKTGVNERKQLTPRSQLHLETIYGSQWQYNVKEIKIGGSLDESLIGKVAKKRYREALLRRLTEFENDPKKAFTGKNSPDKNPIWLNPHQTDRVPDKVKIVTKELMYTIRKEISPDLKVDKVVDKKVRTLLEARIRKYNGDTKKAFSNLEENPIWLNEEKRIPLKRVTISGISNAEALHDKKDKDGIIIPDVNGNPQPVDFVTTGNNHHVAIYRDEKGNLQENVISFFEAVARINHGLPVIDKEFRKQEGWQFLFSMKQNEYFVFPNEQTGFNPNETDLLNPEYYSLISPNIYRVQKFSKLTYGNTIIREYVFRHHLETNVDSPKELKGLTYRVIQSTKNLENIVKVRVNHIGEIVSTGEY